MAPRVVFSTVVAAVLAVGNSAFDQRKVFTWGNEKETPYEAVLRQFSPSKDHRNLVMRHNWHLDCVPNNWHNDVETGAQWVSLRRGGKCPITFARLKPIGDVNTPDDFIIEPFPSWEANGGLQTRHEHTPWRNNPDNLQSVLGFAVDPCHRMWIIDQGSSSDLAATAGMAKVVVYDVSNPDDPRHLFTHRFSEDVVSPTNSFLDDVSVDLKNNFLYITDAGNPRASDLFGHDVRAGLVVYDIAKDESWRVLHQHRSVQPQSSLVTNGEPAPETPGEDYWFNTAGELTARDKPVLVGADGVGLSADTEMFYYTALSATTVWGIPTAALRNRDRAANLEDAVVYVGNTRSAAGGIVSGDDGKLYLTAFTNSSLTRVMPDGKGAPYTPHYLDMEVVAHDDVDMQWPDGIDFDNKGNVVAIANRMHKVVNDEPVPNMIMWSASVGGTKGYMMPWKDTCSTNLFV